MKKTTFTKTLASGALAMVMTFGAVPAIETVTGVEILSTACSAAEWSATEFTATDLDKCCDYWSKFVEYGRGYLLVNYSPNEVEKNAVFAAQSMLNLVASERGGTVLEVDKIYGGASRSRCIQYQASRNLQQDGYLGPATFAALESDCREILAEREIRAGSTVTAPSSVNASTGSATFTVVIKGINITAASYNSENCNLSLESQSGNLSDGIYISFKATNVSSNAFAVVKITTTKGKYQTKIALNKQSYDIANAEQFAYNNAYTNSDWWCAEYVSRILRAGGVNIGILPRCGDLFRALQKLPGVSQYELQVNSNGSINPNSSYNQNKVKKGDVIILVCDSCSDAPYCHAVWVGDCSDSALRVYAHNSAYRNGIYKGFRTCIDHGKTNSVRAICFHFE